MPGQRSKESSLQTRLKQAMQRPESVEGGPARLTTPHFNARLRGTSGIPPRSDALQQSTYGSCNPFLFKLGIVFLEIAYSMNWDTLKKAYSSGCDGDSPNADFSQARKIVKVRVVRNGVLIRRFERTRLTGCTSPRYSESFGAGGGTASQNEA